jgi:DHA1 family tetracycline resistance protein-like MFS transporter
MSVRRATSAFIFATVLLDVLALGVVIPVLAPLVKAFLGGDTARASEITGNFGFLWALMQFVFSPILGALSDRFGRRPIILVSCFGLGFDYVLMALAPSLSWLYVGRILSGITAASFTTAGAYIADVTPPEKRAASYGMMGAAWGLGFVIGPALGGFLGAYSPRLPFWVAGGLSLVNALYGLFALPESLPREKRSTFSWARANPMGSLRLLRSHPELLGLAAVFFLYQLAHQVFPSVFVLFADYRFGWKEQAVGLILTAVGVTGSIVQGGVVRPFVKRFGERVSVLVGLAFGTLGFFVYGFAGTGRLFCLGIPIMAFMGLFGPASQGLMTRRVNPSEQGQLQGANGSLFGISGMLGPLLFTRTFSFFIRPGGPAPVPGAPFLLSGVLLFLALPVAAWVTRHQAGTAPSDSGREPEAAPPPEGEPSLSPETTDPERRTYPRPSS